MWACADVTVGCLLWVDMVDGKGVLVMVMVMFEVHVMRVMESLGYWVWDEIDGHALLLRKFLFIRFLEILDVAGW
jgi:hypothetical protein